MSMNDIETLFDEIMAYPEAERLAQCRRVCEGNETLYKELSSLIAAAEKANGFLSRGFDTQQWLSDYELNPDSVLGKNFGSYRVLRELDSGGMGVVFLAERNDGHYEQQVAIKVSRFGFNSAETIQRFNTERQILADLQHPNIARLIDGGTSDDGYPFLVMENIVGEPIDQYCQNKNLNIRQTLTLFTRVCTSVQFAHQSLVIHCDLKPQNILVTQDGDPKLLDFGVARLLPQSDSKSVYKASTVVAGLTPQFAAPEQRDASGISTATDVYALGAVLYYLICGKAPEIAGEHTRTSVTGLTYPVRTRLISEDVEQVILKALEPNPESRYHSVETFAADLQNCLEDRPISVRALDTSYVLSKWLQRHRAHVFVGSVALMSLVIMGLIAAWQWSIAAHRQQLVENRVAEVRQLSQALVADIPESLDSLPESIELRESLISKGARFLDNLMQTTTAPDETLLQEVATAYFNLSALQYKPASANLGLFEQAHTHLQKAISLRRELYQSNPDDPQRRHDLAEAVKQQIYHAMNPEQRDTQAAAQLARECRELLLPILDSGFEQAMVWYVACYTIEARILTREKQHAQAMTLLDKAADFYTGLSPDHPFHESFHGIRLRNRIDEESAEVLAQTGNPIAAMEHELRRLDRLPKLGEVKGYLRQQGSVYHAVAARQAAVGLFEQALDNYQLSLDRWEQIKQQNPADVSAILTVATLYAEIGYLHRQLNEAGTIASFSQVSCDYFKKSNSLVSQLPNTNDTFIQRYTWSYTPQQMVQNYHHNCVDPKDTSKTQSYP